jgi:hypothetical protein
MAKLIEEAQAGGTGEAERREAWHGTAGELLAELTRLLGADHKPKTWPGNPGALSGRIRWRRPALLAVGIQHSPPAESDKTRTHHIEKVGNRPHEPPASDDAEAAAGPSARGQCDEKAIAPSDRPQESGGVEAVSASSGVWVVRRPLFLVASTRLTLPIRAPLLIPTVPAPSTSWRRSSASDTWPSTTPVRPACRRRRSTPAPRELPSPRGGRSPCDQTTGTLASLLGGSPLNAERLDGP